MTRTPPQSPTPLRNVLYELALAKPVPDAALVDEFVRYYPEYASDLTEYAIKLALDAIAAPNEPIDMPVAITTSSVSRAMSRFYNRLYAVRKEIDAEAAEAPPAVDNPFATLTRSEIRALAQRLDANTVFVMKLRDRLITGATMTEGFLRRLADELGCCWSTSSRTSRRQPTSREVPISKAKPNLRQARSRLLKKPSEAVD